MERDKKLKLKERIKAGNIAALKILLESNYTESLKRYLMTSANHEYLRSQCNTLEEIINLLPDVSE